MHRNDSKDPVMGPGRQRAAADEQHCICGTVRCPTDVFFMKWGQNKIVLFFVRCSMSSKERRVKFALLSIISNTALIIMKVIAGVLSGSVSILSEAIHSGMDLVASLVAYFSVRHSSKPADKGHPYGHGKIENMSAIIEGLLILVAAGLIIKEAAQKFSQATDIQMAEVAIVVMLISALTNLFISRKLYKVAREEDSMALEADALHLKTDVYTSVGVAAGMLLIKVTGYAFLDPIVAILVALLIVKEALHLMSSAFDYLMDARLSDKEEEEIQEIIQSHSSQFIDYHKLKTSKSGNRKLIDFHLTVEPNATVMETHHLVGELKKDMGERFDNCRVTIHLDPSIPPAEPLGR